LNRPRIGRLQTSLFLLTGVILTGIALVLYAVDGLKDLELQTVDARFDVRADRGAPKDLIVVDVDDVTFDELNLRWPFRRTVHAKVLRRIEADRPKAVGYDIQFTEPSEKVQDDLALAEAIDDAPGNVVLGTSAVDPHGHTRILGGDDVLHEIGAHPANANIPPDPGGVLRRMRYEVAKLKTLAVVVSEVATKHKVDSGDFNKDGTAWIDFDGPADTVPKVSFSKVLKGEVPKGTFKNKIVVIGASAPALHDVHGTSTSASGMAGPEIQANAIDTVRRGVPLKSVPDWVNVILIVLLGMAAPLASLRLSAVKTTVLAVGLGTLYVVAALLLFNAGWIVSLVYPLGALLLASFGSLIFHYVTTAFERERTRDLFARFVPENVVDEVIGNTEDLRLGGEEREVTVMFTDIRGFTSFSESMPPKKVIEILNRYLSGMSDAILDHGGTLCAFLGDGILAVFGSPVHQDDHADRALAAGLELVCDRLPEFNEWMIAQGYGNGFNMGVGINSGECLAGNVGSERRLEYTVIGDVVNTASRIEGISKDTPYQLLLAESTRLLLHDEPEGLIDLGDFDVRGRAAKTKLWTHPDERVKKQDRTPKEDAEPALSD
jgi:adenylate cyclase